MFHYLFHYERHYGAFLKYIMAFVPNVLHVCISPLHKSMIYGNMLDYLLIMNGMKLAMNR